MTHTSSFPPSSFPEPLVFDRSVTTIDFANDRIIEDRAGRGRSAWGAGMSALISGQSGLPVSSFYIYRFDRHQHRDGVDRRALSS